MRVWTRLWLLTAGTFSFAGLAPSQIVSIGLMGGVPISPHTARSPDVPLDTRVPMSGPNDLYMKPYAIGPVLDVNLPWRISVEVGMLYERFHQDISSGLMTGHGTSGVNFGFREDLAANGWLFPLLLKYRFGNRRWTPFADAGATLRHLGTFMGQGVQVDFNLNPNPNAFRFATGRDLDVAITVGAGVRCRLFRLAISPELRYLHWTAAYEQPAQDQAMLLLGVTF